MKYLLDTNALIVYVLNFSAFPTTYQRILQDEQNAFVLSPASIWEMAIKVRLGKLHLDGHSLETLTGQLRRATAENWAVAYQAEPAALHCYVAEGERPRRPVRPAYRCAGIDGESARTYFRWQICGLWRERGAVSSRC